MAEVTNTELLQAIKDLSNDVRENSENIQRLEVEMKDMKTELKQDIRKLDKKFTLVLKDLLEVRTDIRILEETAKQ